MIRIIIITISLRARYYNGNFDEHHARVGDSRTVEAAIDGQGVGI